MTSGLKRLKSTRVRALLSLGMVLGLGSVGTLAYWTDQATLTSGTFTAGNLDIKLGSPAPGVDNNPSSFSTDFAMSNMQPGDSKAAAVAVRNSGSIGFTYTATGVTSTAAGIGSLLTFKVVPGGTVNGGATDCTGGTTTFGPATMSSSQNVIATNRPLAAGATETFCVVATLPSGTTSGQGTSASATFTFNAKQVGAP
jgi:predicted ribosomally synthesized peptide with SipW-like signal peptide